MVNAVGYGVSLLDEPDVLLSHFKALGKKHILRNVKTTDFSIVGKALLYVLETGIGASFSTEH